jgi:hypothetical protein
MAELPRLNGIIKALEDGGVAFVGSAPADVAWLAPVPPTTALCSRWSTVPMIYGRYRRGC